MFRSDPLGYIRTQRCPFLRALHWRGSGSHLIFGYSITAESLPLLCVTKALIPGMHGDTDEMRMNYPAQRSVDIKGFSIVRLGD